MRRSARLLAKLAKADVDTHGGNAVAEVMAADISTVGGSGSALAGQHTCKFAQSLADKIDLAQKLISEVNAVFVTGKVGKTGRRAASDLRKLRKQMQEQLDMRRDMDERDPDVA